MVSLIVDHSGGVDMFFVSLIVDQPGFVDVILCH